MLILTFIALAIWLSTSGCTPKPPEPDQPASDMAYVKPGLWTSQADPLAIIVTATDSQTAAQAVERLGGQVTSDLWLIDAVAATLPAGQLKRLAAEPGLISIVENKGVTSSRAPVDGWRLANDR
jgi:hypothetical protein